MDNLLHTEEGLSKEKALQLLEAKIAALLDYDKQAFLLAMYRIDIAESKIVQALNGADPALTLASLVYDRQIQKVWSRQQMKEERSESMEDEELIW